VSRLVDPAKDVESQESDVDVVDLEWWNPFSDMQQQDFEEKSS